MFGAPWICGRCINSSLRPAKRRLFRFASSTKDGGFSPALLTRARNLAAEHDRLIEETAESFDVKIAKRIGELKNVTSALKAWDEAQHSISELQALLADPSTDAELRELAVEDLSSTRSEIDNLSQSLAKSLTPKHPFEDLPCLLEIRPGVGGGEAALFAGDMLRMYQSYCSRVGLRTSILKYDVGDGEGGADPPINEAVLEIENPGAYGKLRSEAGVHRVQRVPATESKGRTHTSAVGVLVLPSFPVSDSQGKEMWEVDVDDPESDYYVDVKDVRTDVLRASGAGGQHVNKTESAVRLTHIPTGTVVSMQDSRSQHQNRAKAWMLLRSKLAQAKREAREEELARMRNSVLGNTKMGRGDKVRTYNYGQQRVTDHRSGVSVYNLDDVMEGGLELDKIVDSVKQWFVDREIEGILADDETAVVADKKKK